MVHFAYDHSRVYRLGANASPLTSLSEDLARLVPSTAVVHLANDHSKVYRLGANASPLITVYLKI